MSILQEMRDRVTRASQWTKFKLHTPKRTRHCLIGWVGEITHEQGLVFDENFKANNLLSSVIREQFPERSRDGNVPWFNDHPDTTFEDVRLVIEKAAIKEQEQI